MKTLFTMFFCVLFAMAGAQPKNDWQEDQLRGKVKSLRAIPYKVKGGEGTTFSKGEIEDDDDLVVFKMSNIYNKYKRYNPEGMLVETRFLFKDETIYLRSEYYYNPQGKLFMERQNSDKIMFVYDPQGFLVKEVTYSPGGFLKSHIDYEVDTQGRREKETYYMSNAPTESTTYQYNRKGQVIVRNCILNELIVQFLQFSISVLISFKESSGILYFGEIRIAKPRYLLSFGKFRKTVYMFHLSC